MRPRWFRRLLPVFMVLALTGPVRAQSSPPLAWWREPKFQKDLGLTADQSNRIDGVFQAALPHMRQRKAELDAQEAELSRLVEADADETFIGRQSDHVEVIRADLNKTRTLMLVHIRQILSPEQRGKFKVFREEREREQRFGSRAVVEIISRRVTRPVRQSTHLLPKGMAMTGNRSSWTMAVALTLAGVTVPAHAQQISEARIKELVRQATERVASAATPQTPTTAPQTGTRIIPLTLDEAVKAALDHNLDIAVQRLNPEINDISYASLKSRVLAVAHLAGRDPVADQRVDFDGLRRRNGGRADRHRAHDLQCRHRPERSLGRRQLHGRAEQQQDDDGQPQHAVQSAYNTNWSGGVRSR